MYQSDTEILFPMRVAPYLRDLRGNSWRELVQMVTDDQEASLNQLAFSLLLVRLSGCLTCHTDSYRAMRGCTICATQVIRRFKGEDKELLGLFKKARRDVKRFLRFDRHSTSFRGIQLPLERIDE
jgi:hypothetical protein